jgi:hypothetical protein
VGYAWAKRRVLPEDIVARRLIGPTTSSLTSEFHALTRHCRSHSRPTRRSMSGWIPARRRPTPTIRTHVPFHRQDRDGHVQFEIDTLSGNIRFCTNRTTGVDVEALMTEGDGLCPQLVISRSGTGEGFACSCHEIASSPRRFGIKTSATALAISRNPFANARRPASKRGGLAWLVIKCCDSVATRVGKAYRL